MKAVDGGRGSAASRASASEMRIGTYYCSEKGARSLLSVTEFDRYSLQLTLFHTARIVMQLLACGATVAEFFKI